MEAATKYVVFLVLMPAVTVAMVTIFCQTWGNVRISMNASLKGRVARSVKMSQDPIGVLVYLDINLNQMDGGVKP